MNLDGPWPDWLPKSPEHILNGVVCWMECCSINSWDGWSASICCCVVRTVTWLPMWSKMADVFWTVHRPEWVGRKTVMSLTGICWQQSTYCLYLSLCVFVVNFDALAQASDFRIERRQVVFLCWMQDLNPESLWNRISSRLNARWQTDWAIEDQAKNLNSAARPYDQRAFSPLDPTAVWHSHLALAIYIFVVVNFDALVEPSGFVIERWQVVFLCWMQDSAFVAMCIHTVTCVCF